MITEELEEDGIDLGAEGFIGVGGPGEAGGGVEGALAPTGTYSPAELTAKPAASMALRFAWCQAYKTW